LTWERKDKKGIMKKRKKQRKNNRKQYRKAEKRRMFRTNVDKI